MNFIAKLLVGAALLVSLMGCDGRGQLDSGIEPMKMESSFGRMY